MSLRGVMLWESVIRRPVFWMGPTIISLHQTQREMYFLMTRREEVPAELEAWVRVEAADVFLKRTKLSLLWEGHSVKPLWESGFTSLNMVVMKGGRAKSLVIESVPMSVKIFRASPSAYQ